nr:uncharacterized protein LOC111502502 [Leptinotarsa decemlineata]
MHTAVEATENGVGTVLGKIGDTLNFTSSAAKDAAEDLEHKKDELVTNAYDTAAEVVSETETILASETESAKEAFTSQSAPIFETVRSFENEIESKTEKLQDNLVGALDDVESDIEQHFDALGDNLKAAEKKVEERLDISLPGSPEKEPKKEELVPTFWEAAADAILLRRTIKSMDFRELQSDLRAESEKSEVDSGVNSEVPINQFLTKDNNDTV